VLRVQKQFLIGIQRGVLQSLRLGRASKLYMLLETSQLSGTEVRLRDGHVDALKGHEARKNLPCQIHL
jgi:hypothetical protein